jgi:hypothetical protein
MSRFQQLPAHLSGETVSLLWCPSHRRGCYSGLDYLACDGAALRIPGEEMLKIFCTNFCL